IIAAKGAPETILRLCPLAPEQQQKVAGILDIFTSNGYRVLGVAIAQWNDHHFPARQEDFPFSFVGLIAFHDPPKPGIRDVFDAFYEAGIKVKVFTGDNEHTTKSIARLAGIRGYDHAMDGEKLMKLNHEAFQHTVKDNILFSRMFPEAKLAAVRSLKEDHHIVAMVGDGVNDGPALKSAHIGIAMGKKGTEIAKSAAALVLVKDDLSTLVEGVAAGRRIYTNLKKAIQYIISIHIPIILTVSIPLLLGWKYPAIFTPIHVIFLELIMGPTCSVAYENEPMEKNAMRMPPRSASQTFFRWHEITISLIQGLMITAGVMAMYLYYVSLHASEPEVRTAVFLTLIFSNIWLTLVNRSFYFSFIETFRYRNRLLTGIMLATLFITGIMIMVPVIRDFFLLAPADWTMIGYCAATALLAVLWIEIVKWRRRSRQIRMSA
ncbi:MAG TPA: cation-translocating P-type ATPase, partial [Saprospiraceae bacterium]|nr:cation-translocating P-type ATPase [Saprospiraceae bacterium]